MSYQTHRWDETCTGVFMRNLQIYASILLSSLLTGCILGGAESSNDLQAHEFIVLPRLNYEAMTGEGWIYFDLLLSDSFQQSDERPAHAAELGGKDVIVVKSGSREFKFKSEVNGVLGGYIQIDDPSSIAIEFHRGSELISELIINDSNGIVPTIDSETLTLDNTKKGAQLKIDFGLPLPYELPSTSAAGFISDHIQCFRDDKGFEQTMPLTLLDEFLDFRYQDLGPSLTNNRLNTTVSAAFASGSASSNLVRGIYEFCDIELRAHFSSGGDSSVLSDVGESSLISFTHSGMPHMSFSISKTSAPIAMRVFKSALQ